VSAVHDYATWLKGEVWETSHSSDKDANSLVHLKKNRYFKIRRRTSDGAVCLWYKPDPLHEITYPVKKNEFGDPITELRPNGSEEYFTDWNGIEVFRTLEGPKGQPPLAPFPSKTAKKQTENSIVALRCKTCEKEDDDNNSDGDNDQSLPCDWNWEQLSEEQRAFATLLSYDSHSWYYDEPRCITWKSVMMQPHLRVAAMALGFTAAKWIVDPDFDPKAGETSTFIPRLEPAKTIVAIRYLLDNHKDEWIDAESDRAFWEEWAATHPTTVDDVIDKPQWEWPKGCQEYTRNLPAELMNANQTFAETIEYRNVIQASELNTAQLQQNISDYHQERSGTYTPMTKGTFLWVKHENEESQDVGWNVPLWCARLRSDEAPDVQPCDDDTFEIEWWGSFYNNVLRDSMDYAFKPICCGWRPFRMSNKSTVRRFHPFVAKTCTGLDGHGLHTGTVTRAEIRLTSPGAYTLTDKGCLRSGVGTDVKSRLASCLLQDGFTVSDYLNGNFKNAKGSHVDIDVTGERIWEKAARAAKDLQKKQQDVKRKLD